MRITAHARYVASGKTELDGMLAIDDEDLSYSLDRYGFPTPSRIKPCAEALGVEVRALLLRCSRGVSHSGRTW